MTRSGMDGDVMVWFWVGLGLFALTKQIAEAVEREGQLRISGLGHTRVATEPAGHEASWTWICGMDLVWPLEVLVIGKVGLIRTCDFASDFQAVLSNYYVNAAPSSQAQVVTRG